MSQKPSNIIIEKDDHCEIILYNKDKEQIGVCLFDKEDTEKVKKHCWYKSKRGYVCTRINYKNIVMNHLLGGKPKKGLVSDHINGDRLDNRKLNLRFATYKENGLNRKNVGKSKYRGICIKKINKKGIKYLAHIKIDGKTKFLGYGYNEKELYEKCFLPAYIKAHGVPPPDR
jgi:hypothetical protein